MVGTTVKTSQGTALSLFSASSCCSMHVQIKDTSSLPTPAARQRCVTLRFFSNFLPFLFVPSFFFTCSLPQHLPGFLPHIPIVAFGKKKFIIALTKASSWSLFLATWNQSTGSHYFYKIHFNIILPYSPGFSKLCFSMRWSVMRIKLRIHHHYQHQQLNSDV